MSCIISAHAILHFQQMENEHTHEIGMIQQDINKLRSQHERTLQALEADFNVRLISEYDRYQVKYYLNINILNIKLYRVA